MPHRAEIFHPPRAIQISYTLVPSLVNQWTVELGNLGERALETLADRVVSEATKTISIVK